MLNRISYKDYQAQYQPTKPKKTKRQHELKLQIAIVNHIRALYGDLIWIKGSDYTSKSLQEGAKKKALGYTKGMPDLELVDKRKAMPTMFMELKTAEDKLANIKKGRESKEQAQLREQYIKSGYRWVVISSIKEAIKEAEDYFELNIKINLN